MVLWNYVQKPEIENHQSKIKGVIVSKHRKRKKNKKARRTFQPRLTLCMIVKNEERFLEGCLQSVHGVVDEIVIVDTGSTDRTVEIAERCGAKIFNFEWDGDFSAARNESLRHATGDWILYLDADEQLAPGQGKALRTLLNNPNVGGYTLLVGGEHQLPSGVVRQVNSYPRLFRRYPTIRFEGKVHEQITPSIQRLGKAILPTDIFIEHLGYAQSLEVVREKCWRNISLLRDQLKQNPQDAYARFQLGNTLTVLEEYDAAREELKQALSSSNLSPSVRASVLNLLAEIEIKQGRFSEAVDTCLESLRFARRQVMARWFLAATQMTLQNFSSAIAPLKEILELHNDRDKGRKMDIAYDLVLDEADVLYRLGVCYEGVRSYREATEAFFQALLKNPELNDALQGLLHTHEVLAEPRTLIYQLEALRTDQPLKVELLLPLARNYWKIGNRAVAFDFIQKTLAVDPENPIAYALETRWRIEEGNYPDAERALAEAEAKGIVSYDLHKCALELALRRRDVHKAFKHLEKMAETVPPDRKDLKERLAALGARLSAGLS